MSLPIEAVLPELHATLAEHNIVALAAPPGSGKTTVVPLSMLDRSPVSEAQSSKSQAPNWLGNQTILMLEPRRLAVRTAAQFMATSLQEKVGRTVGYQVRFDRQHSSATRIDIITEGILTRRMQSDPELSGIGCIIFDEFHERSLHADLGLTLALDIQKQLRPDLRILLMSATLELESLRSTLVSHGQALPIVQGEGRSYPVDIRHLSKPAHRGQSHVQQLGSSSLFQKITTNTLFGIQTALQHDVGDMLVFLPGVGEIKAVAKRLEHFLQTTTQSIFTDQAIKIAPLYGELSPQEQDEAIQPTPNQRRVVLATSIAETSLTINGIQVVIDSGYSRVPCFDPNTGLNALQTKRVSQASAEQRAGRAGRLGPGIAYRLWPQEELLADQQPPEITQTDCTTLALEVAAWGASVDELTWLTPPPSSNWQQAIDLLLQMEAIQPTHQQSQNQHNQNQDCVYRITQHGQAMLKLGVQPRLAHMLLKAKQAGFASQTICSLAALLNERDIIRYQPQPSNNQPDTPPIDIELRIDTVLQNGSARHTIGQLPINRATLQKVRQLAAQLEKQLRKISPMPAASHTPHPSNVISHATDIGVCIAWAWPERIARQRQAHVVDNRPSNSKTMPAAQEYQLANGSGALCQDISMQHEYLAVAHLAPTAGAGNVTNVAGKGNHRIRLAAKLTEPALHEYCANDLTEVATMSWQDDVPVFAIETRYQALVLHSKRIQPTPEQLQAAIVDHMQTTQSLALLTWNDDAKRMQARLAFCHHQQHLLPAASQAAWPDMSDAALLASLTDWLVPYLHGINSIRALSKLNVAEMLLNRLPYTQQQQLNALAPERITVPSGAKTAVDYSSGEPVLAVKLQECFGWLDTPRIYNEHVPVTMHLLSPARRPVQVTQDLASFWKNTYSEVRKELAGRYPKHPWPVDPSTATATALTKKRIAAAKSSDR